MEFLLKDFVGKPSIVEKRKQISYVLHSMKSISCCLCYCVADRSLLTCAVHKKIKKITASFAIHYHMIYKIKFHGNIENNLNFISQGIDTQVSRKCLPIDSQHLSKEINFIIQLTLHGFLQGMALKDPPYLHQFQRPLVVGLNLSNKKLREHETIFRSITDISISNFDFFASSVM